MQASQAIAQAFRPIENLCNRAKELNAGYLMKCLFLDGYFKALIIDLNTDKQLFDKGIDATGKKLRNRFRTVAAEYYSKETIRIKSEKGQPTDRITLKDSGDFYSTFKLELKNGAFFIDADTVKDDNDLAQVWGADILGLTQESLQEVIDLSLEILIPVIRNKLLNG